MSYSPEFIEQVLEEAKESKTIVAVAKKHRIPDSTIHTWMRKKEHKPVSDLSSENKKLKKELSESKQKIDLLRDMLKKSFHVFEVNRGLLDLRFKTSSSLLNINNS